MANPKDTSGGLLGRIAVEMELITPEQLSDSIRFQGEQVKARLLGDVMVELGHLAPAQLKTLLDAQKQWLKSGKRLAAADGVGATDFSDTQAAEEGYDDEDPFTLIDVHPHLGSMLYEGRHQGALDLHLQSGSMPFLRVNGEVVEMSDLPLSTHAVRDILYSMVDKQAQEVFEREGDLDFAWDHFRLGRTRVSAFVGERGPGLVMRLVPMTVPTLTDLSLPSVVARATTYHEGLVLVTGPAGSGKSSTVAALVRLLNEERRQNILILEDPIEFRHDSLRSNVIQRQVPEHTESFTVALRAALREDPDVIVIGEMRDPETISLAITAAETGHLVLGTLHTANAVGTIDRIISSFPSDQQSQARAMLSESLRAVISQALIPRVDGRGRVPAVELLFNTPAVANLIRDSRTFQLENVLQTNRKAGMRRMVDSLQELASAGIISVEAGRGQT